MKYYCLALVLILILAISPAYGQIPNAGFENWTNGNPDNWLTNNVPPAAVPITQSSSAHSGSWAVQGAVVAFSSITLPPELVSGSNGFPISSRPGALHGFYKLSATGHDSLFVSIVLLKSGTGIGGGEFATGTAAASYTEFVANIQYSSSDIADTALISIILGNASGFPHVGSVFTIDNLSFGPATGVDQPRITLPSRFELSQNYPNPFNPTTTLSYSLPQRSFVTLKLYDLLGREVRTLVNGEQEPGNYTRMVDANDLPSGVYFYRLSAGPLSGQSRKFTDSKRMVLLK